MTKAKPRTRRVLFPFDATRYLTDDAAEAEYLAAALETGDDRTIRAAADDVARARESRMSVRARVPR